MGKVQLFLGHARRLRDKARRAKRLARAIPHDEAAQKLRTLASIWEARSAKAEQCAQLAEQRDGLSQDAKGLRL